MVDMCPVYRTEMIVFFRKRDEGVGKGAQVVYMNQMATIWLATVAMVISYR